MKATEKKNSPLDLHKILKNRQKCNIIVNVSCESYQKKISVGNEKNLQEEGWKIKQKDIDESSENK